MAARLVVEDCFKWANQRQVFGKRLIDQPVIRNKLAGMVNTHNGDGSNSEKLTVWPFSLDCSSRKYA
jgi:hypothetical protein